MIPKSHDFESMFTEAIAFNNDAEIQAMIRRAKRLWLAGDSVSAYYILHAFGLGYQIHAMKAERAEAINQKLVPLKQALYDA